MRLFVALDLPWELKQTLAALAINLNGARWVPAPNLHLTLRFIGESNRLQAEEIDHALSAVRARGFDLTLVGAGWFEKAGRANTLYIGVARNEALLHLQTKIETALRRAGLNAERRRFIPHVSLARMDQPVTPRLIEFVQARNLFRAPSFRVEHITLFSSHLGGDVPDYTAEIDYPLAPPAAA